MYKVIVIIWMLMVNFSAYAEDVKETSTSKPFIQIGDFNISDTLLSAFIGGILGVVGGVFITYLNNKSIEKRENSKNYRKKLEIIFSHLIKLEELYQTTYEDLETKKSNPEDLLQKLNSFENTKILETLQTLLYLYFQRENKHCLQFFILRMNIHNYLTKTLDKKIKIDIQELKNPTDNFIRATSYLKLRVMNEMKKL